MWIPEPARRNSARLDQPSLPTPGTSYTEPVLGGVILCANTFLVERLSICLEFERENGKAGRTLEIWCNLHVLRRKKQRSSLCLILIHPTRLPVPMHQVCIGDSAINRGSLWCLKAVLSRVLPPPGMLLPPASIPQQRALYTQLHGRTRRARRGTRTLCLPTLPGRWGPGAGPPRPRCAPRSRAERDGAQQLRVASGSPRPGPAPALVGGGAPWAGSGSRSRTGRGRRR